MVLSDRSKVECNRGFPQDFELKSGRNHVGHSLGLLYPLTTRYTIRTSKVGCHLGLPRDKETASGSQWL